MCKNVSINLQNCGILLLIIPLVLIMHKGFGQIVISGDTCSNTPNNDYEYENYTFGNHGYGYRVEQNNNEVFYKEVYYDYIRATNMHFVNDSVGFLSEIPGGVLKTETFGTSWSFFSWQGNFHWSDDAYNGMYFINEDVGYFACYALTDTIYLHKLGLNSIKKLFSMPYDSVSHYFTLTDTINNSNYFCDSLNHLLFTWYIQDDTIQVNLTFIIDNTMGIAIPPGFDIRYFPNPTKGPIQIDLGSEYTNLIITVKNILGQIISSYRYPTVSHAHIILPGEPGFYLIEIMDQMGKYVAFKAIKE